MTEKGVALDPLGIAGGEGDQVERLKALANPLRMRILEQIAHRPMTVSQVAAALGEPRTKLYRHVAVLQKQGFVKVASKRKVSGILEKTYELVSRGMMIEKSVPASRKKEFETALESGLAGLFQQSQEEIRRAIEVGRIDFSRVEEGGSLVAARGYMQLSERQAEEFVQRLQRQLKEIEGSVTGDGEDTDRYSFTMVFHPAPEDSGKEGEA